MGTIAPTDDHECTVATGAATRPNDGMDDRDWRMGRPLREAPVATSRALTEMTCVADGRSHRLTDAAFEDGLRARLGRFTAVCGHSVLAAALATRPGRPCPECLAQDAAAQRSGSDVRRRFRPRRKLWTLRWSPTWPSSAS